MRRESRARSWLTGAGVAALIAMLTLRSVPDRSVHAASFTSSDQSGIVVSGVGSVWVVPDVARLSLGVSSTAGTVADARARAAGAMLNVQNALLANGVGAKDIQTQYINISPQYSYVGGGQPRISGYTASNQLQVTVRKIDSASAALDAAVAAGGDAVRVNGISFTVDDPTALMSQAREAAVMDAFARASVLAKAAGVSVGRPRSIVESGGSMPVTVAPKAAAGAGDAVPTPVNPGEQQLQVSVSIVYDMN